MVLVVALVYLGYFYQPVRVIGTFGTESNASSGQTRMSYNDVTVSNGGISPVSIISIGKAVSNFDRNTQRIGNIKLCTFKHKGNVSCEGRQDTGAGVVSFHSFDIPTNKQYDLLWVVKYNCQSTAPYNSMNVPMTIHYMGIFTRTITLSPTTFESNCATP